MTDNLNNTLRQLSHKKRTVSDLISFLSNNSSLKIQYSAKQPCVASTRDL